MAEITAVEVREFLNKIQGKEISIDALRKEFQLVHGMKSWDSIRNIMFQLAEAKTNKIVKPTGKRDGTYKIIQQVLPVKVFGKERRQPIELIFPRDFNTGDEMFFAEDLIIREGDLILIAGQSNFGKTLLCMNFCGENIDSHPVLMGNEYTTLDNEPSPRFLHRLDAMDWVEWCNGDGEEKFTLLPVRDDYAEHIVKDKNNIVDWINIETGEHYMIGTMLQGMKREVGKGVVIAAIQKSAGADAGRGGQFTKDFADIEILLDRFGETDEVLLTIGKVKESKRRVMGRKFVYSIEDGVKITNFREVIKCSKCYGSGWMKVGTSKVPCSICRKTGMVDKIDYAELERIKEKAQ